MNFSFYKTAACLCMAFLAGLIPVAKTVAVNDNGKTLLALGDSYTIGQSVLYRNNYPEQTVSILNDSGVAFSQPEIIATTGWTTGDLLAAIADKPVPVKPYTIVTLLIGVNNQYQGRSITEYETQFTTLLQKSIAYAGNKAAHVIVLSIPDYAATIFGRSTGDSANISYQLNAFNAINKQIALNYGVNYINITDESRKVSIDPALGAADGLHYSAKEYRLWAAMIAATIKTIR